LIHRVVDPRYNLDIAGVESLLPLVRQGYHDVTANEFRPMHVVAGGG
jgi:hypothetical protein